jgi:hypothetical protein
VAVLFDGVEVKPQGLTDDQMVATAPAGIAERDGTGVTISVRTSTGTQTAAATQLTAQAPKISSVQRADDVLTIHGYGLRSADGTQPGIVVKDSTGSVLQVQPMTREQMTHLAMSGAISVALRQAPAKPPVSVSILINGAVTAEATSSN